MTLEVILWAIPIASLTAASVLIGLRLYRITRDTLVQRELLAEAGNAALLSARQAPDTVAEFRRPAARKTRPTVSRPAAPPPPKCRLEPVSIIVCRTESVQEALAG
jgi:hypothetical protein